MPSRITVMAELIKSYKELMTLKTFNERLDYLKLYSKNPSNKERELMNRFYKSKAWLSARDEVIKRDLACDLGIQNLFIDVDKPGESMIVHHINPISLEDLESGSDLLLDPENLITVSASTHNTIHYSKEEREELVERCPGDTTLW